MLAQYETKLKYRKQDENGDMTFGGSDADFVETAAAMKQVLVTRLGACEDEWWEGDDAAIPWFSDVLGQMVAQGKVEEIDLLVIERIMDTVGVNSVSNITSGVTNRKYHFSCTVNTVYGSIPVEVST